MKAWKSRSQGSAMHGLRSNPCYFQVPIQRMDVVRPVAAASNSQALTSKAAPQRQRPTKKRRKAVAGGSTILAALFCFFMYCGIGIPNVGLSIGNPKLPMGSQFRALPSASSSELNQLIPNGRVLQGIESKGKYLCQQGLAYRSERPS